MSAPATFINIIEVEPDKQQAAEYVQRTAALASATPSLYEIAAEYHA